MLFLSSRTLFLLEPRSTLPRAPLASPIARPRHLRALARSRRQGMSGRWQSKHALTASSAATNTTSGTATGTASTSDVSSAQTATQTGSANQVGPASALAVTLAVLGFTTLGF